MVIPDNINHLNFYEAAKRKGIKIQSRFAGVVMNTDSDGKSPTWMARFQRGGKVIFFKRCAFNAEGEKEAAIAYVEYMQANNLKLRRPYSKLNP